MTPRDGGHLGSGQSYTGCLVRPPNKMPTGSTLWRIPGNYILGFDAPKGTERYRREYVSLGRPILNTRLGGIRPRAGAAEASRSPHQTAQIALETMDAMFHHPLPPLQLANFFQLPLDVCVGHIYRFRLRGARGLIVVVIIPI